MICLAVGFLGAMFFCWLWAILAANGPDEGE